MEKVRVTIDPKTGTMKAEVEGVTGGACDEITRAFRQNNQEVDYQQTSEYCEPVQEKVGVGE